MESMKADPLPMTEPNEPTEAEENAEEPQRSDLPWSEIITPVPLTKLFHTKYVFFGGIAGFFYMLHFICCLGACNFYADATRLLPCYNPETGEEIVGEAASRILDVGIKLGGIYHILSWVKYTILLVNILVGVNLLTIWYASYLEIPFFLGTFIYIHMVYFSDQGKECQLH